MIEHFFCIQRSCKFEIHLFGDVTHSVDQSDVTYRRSWCRTSVTKVWPHLGQLVLFPLRSSKVQIACKTRNQPVCITFVIFINCMVFRACYQFLVHYSDGRLLTTLEGLIGYLQSRSNWKSVPIIFQL